MRTLGKVILFVLASVGLLTVALGVVVWALAARALHGGLAAATAATGASTVPAQTVLTVDLTHAYGSRGGSTKMFGFGPADATLRDIVDAIKRGGTDPRVKGLVAQISPSDIGFADVQELRAAIAAFRISGKPTFVFAHDLGTSAPREYYLASSFSDIWLQPSGSIGLTGFASEVPFISKALDNLGVGVTVGARYEYKDAVDPLTRTSMSDAQRASTKRLLDSWLGQVEQGVSTSRHISLDAVKTIVQGPPLFASEALKAGLIDHIGYEDQMDDAVKAATHTDAEISAEDYAQATHDKPAEGASHFAYIAAAGTIQAGPSTQSAMGADTVAGAISDAINDPAIKAIILHIDSPGGDYVAADTIWRQVKRARDKHLPVVVSMGNLAASGGYFMAMPANKIVAEPGTITGSVGVFSLKPQLSKLWDKLDVHWDTVEQSDYALMWSTNRDFTPAQHQYFEHMLDVIYQDFTGKLAEGRSLDPKKIDDVARGRVWSGTDAKAVGLVDDLGGLDVAIADAQKEAGLTGNAPVTLVPFPKPKSQIDQIIDMIKSGNLPMTMSRLEMLADVSSSVMGNLRRSGLTTQGAALQAPPVGVREEDQ